MSSPFAFISNKINTFNDIILIGHKNPDGDAVGSLTALALGLESLNKNVQMAIIDPVPKMFAFLNGVNKITDKFTPSPNKLIILIDCGTFKRTGFIIGENLKHQLNAICIDHHPREKDTVEGINCTNASATAEIIFELLNKLNIDINHTIAVSLLTGILTDTGGFQHSNTTSKTLKIAAKLLSRGVPLTKISESVFRHKDINILKIWGRALARIKIDPETKMATSIITKKEINKSDIKQSEISGISSIINTAREINFALLLTEFNNTTKGSLRSEKGKGINVAKIAQLFNGGGHPLAAGFEMEGGLKKNISKINTKITGNMKSAQSI